jgi:hypothetical protein
MKCKRPGQYLTLSFDIINCHVYLDREDISFAIAVGEIRPVQRFPLGVEPAFGNARSPNSCGLNFSASAKIRLRNRHSPSPFCDGSYMCCSSSSCSDYLRGFPARTAQSHVERCLFQRGVANPK